MHELYLHRAGQIKLPLVRVPVFLTVFYDGKRVAPFAGFAPSFDDTHDGRWRGDVVLDTFVCSEVMPLSWMQISRTSSVSAILAFWSRTSASSSRSLAAAFQVAPKFRECCGAFVELLLFGCTGV